MRRLLLYSKPIQPLHHQKGGKVFGIYNLSPSSCGDRGGFSEMDYSTTTNMNNNIRLTDKKITKANNHGKYMESIITTRNNYREFSKTSKKLNQIKKKDDYDPQNISRNAVLKAIAGNTFITAIKFAAYITSGSATLLAETCHSLIDSLNQGLLYMGIKQSSKIPDQKYQYGYGRARYFYSLVSALGIWWIGSFSVMYNGINTLIHPPTHPTHPHTEHGHSEHHSAIIPTHDIIDKDTWSYTILNSMLPDQMVTTMMCHYGLVTPVVLLISFIIDGKFLFN